MLIRRTAPVIDPVSMIRFSGAVLTGSMAITSSYCTCIFKLLIGIAMAFSVHHPRQHLLSTTVQQSKAGEVRM